MLFLLFYNLCTGEEDGYKQLEGFFFSFFFFIKPKCVWEGHDNFCVTPFDFARNGSSRSLVSVWGPGTDSGRLVESFTFFFAFFFLRFSFNTGIPIIHRHQRISLSWKPLAPSLVVDNFTKKSKTKRAQKRLDAAAFFLYSFRSEFNSRDTLTHTISQPLNHTLTFSHQIYRKPENIYKKEKNNKKSVFFFESSARKFKWWIRMTKFVRSYLVVSREFFFRVKKKNASFLISASREAFPWVVFVSAHNRWDAWNRDTLRRATTWRECPVRLPTF